MTARTSKRRRGDDAALVRGINLQRHPNDAVTMAFATCRSGTVKVVLPPELAAWLVDAFYRVVGYRLLQHDQVALAGARDDHDDQRYEPLLPCADDDDDDVPRRRRAAPVPRDDEDGPRLRRSA
jgi:hypothetical protein